jgi:hypothetical protein
MLTKLVVRNFKRFRFVEIELGNPVVFIGPNNSGKTSALQALALWDAGIKRWNEKRSGKKTTPAKRAGVAINRKDLITVPVPDANLLWRGLHVRDVQRNEGGQTTQNVRIDLVVEGVTDGKEWKCGFEFDYANEESFYCRPLRLTEEKDPERMEIPMGVEGIQMAFLPPMSGLASNETRLDPGAINVRVGEGRTAEVLRNLCHMIAENQDERWEKLVDLIRDLFGSDLDRPRYIPERGEIVMGYRENGVHLDLSSSGRGLQQTLLLLAYMLANPGAVILLDEPDAHLEILRQRQIYQILCDLALENGNQIIAASHSEVLLNEAADRDVVVAFLGKPHRIDDRGSQVLKSLREIGFDQYYQAEQTGWVLYLEGSTDLAILREFAKRLGHMDAIEILSRPFVYYVGNQPQKVKEHFFALREAVKDLQGIAVFDCLEKELPQDPCVKFLMWTRREIENYICYPGTLEAFARASAKDDTGPLFQLTEAENRVSTMRECIRDVTNAMETLGKGSPWDITTKVSDEFLTPLFEKYYKKLGLPNLMAKKSFYELAKFIPVSKMDNEIREKLDAIVETARRSTRCQDLP